MVFDSASQRSGTYIKKFFSIALLLLLLFITIGCGWGGIVLNIIHGPTPSPAVTNRPDDPTSTDSINITEIQDLTDSVAKTGTLLVLSFTPEEIATKIPTFAPTATPEATLKKGVDIISGPGKGYYFIIAYPKGSKFEIIGISKDKNWFQIRIYNWANRGTGWAPISVFDYDFDIQTLTEIENPPTPTPQRIITNSEEPSFPHPNSSPTLTPTPTRTFTPTPAKP
jgi:hypothetical protein